eukprot:TRINITY_DN32075_c0_g1_i1.p1 TRINITY_DN32075_c0_g1~~TRINITY_DN32075_c0_g1_i1.p1  ORF type:complete len:343 (-),score=46.95 TRINITY_DN32075_c0_g1_i1:42-1070(-)
MNNSVIAGRQAPICIYAPFCSQWEATTGIPTSRCHEIANVFLKGCAAKLPGAHVEIVSSVEAIPEGGLVILGCALGNETSKSFEAARSCTVPSPWFDWINAKVTYLSELAQASVPIIPSWHIKNSATGNFTLHDLVSGEERVVEIGHDSEAVLAACVGSQPGSRFAVKACNSIGGGVAVQLLEADKAVASIVQLVAEGTEVFIQPDMGSAFAERGEHKVCVHVESGQVLGCRHVCPSPGKEFGNFLQAEMLPSELTRVVSKACEVIRAHAAAAPKSWGMPLLLRVDCIELQAGKWALNEIETTDFACWMWGSACEGGCEDMNAQVFAAVAAWCKSHHEQDCL